MSRRGNDTLIKAIPQSGGGMRRVHAQDAAHARRARDLLRADPALVDHLDGLDGIRITIEDGR